MVALNPTRNLAAPAAIEAVLDRPCPVCSATLGETINMVTGDLLSRLLGPETRTAVHFLDEAWVAREKGAAAGGVVEFVSTNDLVTSAFLCASRADLAFMVVNPPPWFRFAGELMCSSSCISPWELKHLTLNPKH